jgi:hypothetical protein
MGFLTDDLTPFVFPLSVYGEGEGFLGGLARLPRRAKLREVTPPIGGLKPAPY